MNTELDTVVARIRKLMALTAERGASEAEAALAAEHVQRLLGEHNLSMAAVEASGGSSGNDGKRVREGVQRRQVYRWQRELMSAVADLNYCKSFIRWKTRWNKASIFDGYELIGRAANVATATVMFEYLLQTIERLAREEVLDPSQYFTRYAHSFKEGCSDRLVERLRHKRDEIVAEADRKAREERTRSRHPGAARSNLPALVLSDVIQQEKDLNEDFQYGRPPGTTARERAEREARSTAAQIERETKEKTLVAQGIDPRVAYYIAAGYSQAVAEELARPTPEKPETDAQRRRREAREERDNDRFWERYQRRQEREAARIDQGAYRKGHAAGSGVGLDPQLRRGSNNRRIGGWIMSELTRPTSKRELYEGTVRALRQHFDDSTVEILTAGLEPHYLRVRIAENNGRFTYYRVQFTEERG